LDPITSVPLNFEASHWSGFWAATNCPPPAEAELDDAELEDAGGVDGVADGVLVASGVELACANAPEIIRPLIAVAERRVLSILGPPVEFMTRNVR
jgi:hypothetical protein